MRRESTFPDSSRRDAVLESLVGSEKKEKVLLYIYTHGEAYAREMASAFGMHVNVIQHHLENLEYGGVLYSKLRGKVRLFGLNPRYPFRKELEALLEKVLSFVPEDEKSKLYKARLKPRRSAKPL
jgi:DNA-binding transcriptional ArsR family regulator